MQPGVRTVEGELRAALDSVYGRWDSLAVAGRTDTGVHALANVASAEVEGGPPTERAREALNAVLPDDLAIVAADPVAEDFHARHSARARAYRYRILRRRAPSPLEARRAWWNPRPLDRAALDESAALLVGEHDFRAFTPSATQHRLLTRTVLQARWVEVGELLELEIEANSFLRHMVRTLVGTMVDQSPAQVSELLRGGGRREDAGSTAPPWGLYLERVRY